MIQNEVRKFSARFIAPTFTEALIYGILLCWSQLRSFAEATRNLKQSIFCHSRLFYDLEDLS